jgi:ABC-2 type transport system permease protein
VSLFSSELVKLRTIRTPYVLLLLAVAISAIAAAGLVGSGSLGDNADPALSLGQGASFGTLFVAVLGILIVTNEYRHGTIMTTFLAEPRRVRVLLAKLGVAGLAGLAFAVAVLVVAAAVALPWVAARDESLPLDGQALEAVGRTLLVFALTAVIGAAVGAIVQSQVGAIVGYFVWSFVVESLITVLSGLVFTDVGEPDPISKYLPGSALSGIVGGEGNEFVLRGGTAALLALGYALGLSALAVVSITRRDP